MGDDVIAFLEGAEFTIVTVVLDKTAHRKRYVSPDAPYDYCMEVVMERYQSRLEVMGAVGDIMAESRNGKMDKQLKALYARCWRTGTRFISASQYQARFTSKELKIKEKEANIAGLQVADLIAAPSKLDILSGWGRLIPMSPFTQRVNAALRKKYMQVGRKFLD